MSEKDGRAVDQPADSAGEFDGVFKDTPGLLTIMFLMTMVVLGGAYYRLKRWFARVF